MEQSPLEKLMYYASRGDANAKQFSENARQQLKTIRKFIDDQEKLEQLKVFDEVMNSVNANQYKAAKSHAARAQQTYVIIKPILEKTMRDRDLQERASGLHQHHSIPEKHQRGSNDIPPKVESASPGKYVVPELGKRNERHYIAKEISSNWGPKEIADGFHAIYENDWVKAFDAVKSQLSDRDIYKFLIAIVQEAYLSNYSEATKQITDMEKGALDIVIGENSEKNKTLPTARGDRSLLLQYRKDNAGIATDRLTQDFNANILLTICKKFSADPVRFIKVFAALCVEITWWMCVQDPPVHMVCYDGRREFDPNMYKPCRKSGKTIDVIVWPPLLQCEKGTVLIKGVALCK